MKKMVCFIFALLVVISSLTVASATQFTESIPCKSVNQSAVSLGCWDSKGHNGAIYIYHNVKTKVKTKHNNLFYLSESDEYTSPYYSHWLTPGVNRRCASSSISDGVDVWVSARGNTKYYEDNSSIQRITINGSFGWKL